MDNTGSSSSRPTKEEGDRSTRGRVGRAVEKAIKVVKKRLPRRRQTSREMTDAQRQALEGMELIRESLVVDLD